MQPIVVDAHQYQKTPMKKAIFSLLTLATIVLLISCEKQNDSGRIDGTWVFEKSCNKVYYIACLTKESRGFTETLHIREKYLSKYYNDSLLYSIPFQLTDSLIMYNEDGNAVQEYSLQNDTLILTDTCLACNYIIYIRE